MDFPLTFSKCPNCRTKIGVAESIANEEKEKGSMGADGKGAITVIQTAIYDTRRTVLMAPVVTALVDACPKCGTLYAVHIERHMAPVGMPGKQI